MSFLNKFKPVKQDKTSQYIQDELNKYNPQNNMQQARKSIEELQRENDKMRQDYINMYKQLQSQAQALREANEHTSERSR